MGVYATAHIKVGEIVLGIDDSHVVTDPSLLTAEQNEYDCDYLADGKVILMQEPEKYINHSCNPSSYVKTTGDIRKVIAVRDIQIGQEITYDYSMNGDNEGTFTCHCGASNCRGVYNGNFFKLPLEIQKKCLSYLDDWFVKEHSSQIRDIK